MDVRQILVVSEIISRLSVVILRMNDEEHRKIKDLKALVPTLEDKIGEWEKKQIEVKQAKCFSKEELTTFFEMPTTIDNLLDKAYAAIALSFAARGARCSDKANTRLQKPRCRQSQDAVLAPRAANERAIAA